MRPLVIMIVMAVIATSAARAGAPKSVDINQLANFITIKEYMHCAQYNVALVNRNVPPPGARAGRVERAGGFIAAALKIDGSMTARGVGAANQYIATLSLEELDRRYKIICTQMDKARRINDRLFDWRYRLNAMLPVPVDFYKMNFAGAMPQEWYLKE